MPISKLYRVVKNLTLASDELQKRSKTLSMLMTIGIWGLLTWQLTRNLQVLPPGFLSNVNYVLLLISLGVLIFALLLVSLRWRLTLLVIHTPIAWWRSIKIWFLSQVGRYLPGGIWSYVGRFYLGRSEIPKESIIVSMALETGLRVISETLVFLMALPFWGSAKFFDMRLILLLLGGTGLGLFMLHPVNFERVSRMLPLKWLGVKPLDLSKVRYCHMLGLLSYCIMTIFIVGGAFFLLVRALYPLPASHFLVLTGSLTGSIVLGFLIPLTPNGWGIREGVLTFLLSSIMPSSIAFVISIVTRIWLIVGEGILITIILGLQMFSKRDNPKGLFTKED
jgi:hypothetical protein